MGQSDPMSGGIISIDENKGVQVVPTSAYRKKKSMPGLHVNSTYSDPDGMLHKDEETVLQAHPLKLEASALPQHPQPKYRKKTKIMTSSGRSSNLALQPILNSSAGPILSNQSQIRMTEEPDSES